MKQNYWNYTVKSRGQNVVWDKGVETPVEDMRDIADFSMNAFGKYSSLENAINGFLQEKCNLFSKVVLTPDKEGFLLKTETYQDYFGRPVSDVVFRKWKNGNPKRLLHCWLEVFFIYHEVSTASLEDFSKIQRKFPDIEKI